MIRDNDPLTNRYISVPRDYSPLNCASFMGGILRGALTTAGFVRDSDLCIFFSLQVKFLVSLREWFVFGVARTAVRVVHVV